MAPKLKASQYKLLSRYCEDLSKAIALSCVAGFFFPSVLPSAIMPSWDKAVFGGAWALTFLGIAIILVEKGKK